MNNAELILMREIIKAISDNHNVIFKPAPVRVRRVPTGSVSKLYPLHTEVDDGRRYIGGDCPSSSITNSRGVYDYARTFGVRSRM